MLRKNKARLLFKIAAQLEHVCTELIDMLHISRESTWVCLALVILFMTGILDRLILHTLLQNIVNNPQMVAWAVGVITGGFAAFRKRHKK